MNYRYNNCNFEINNILFYWYCKSNVNCEFWKMSTPSMGKMHKQKQCKTCIGTLIVSFKIVTKCRY